MIPYLEPPSVSIFGLTIWGFGVMVGLALVVGFSIVERRALRFGFDADVSNRVTVLIVIAGFIGSHWFDVLTYFPEKVAANPLELLRFNGSMSSFGGMLGGLIGAALTFRWYRWSRSQALQFIDVIAWAFPFAWLFGRFGCTLAHDHMGIPSTLFIAVNFPEGPRLDLGLIEFLLTIPIAISFYLLDKKPRPAGFYLALFFTVYSPVRFGLDFLRTADARYAGLTPAQYVAIVTALIGVLWLVRLYRAPISAARPPNPGNTEEPKGQRARKRSRKKRA